MMNSVTIGPILDSTFQLPSIFVKEYSQHYRAVHPKEGTAAATTEPHETEIREWIAADLARLAQELCAEFHSIRSGAAPRGHNLPA